VVAARAKAEEMERELRIAQRKHEQEYAGLSKHRKAVEICLADVGKKREQIEESLAIHRRNAATDDERITKLKAERDAAKQNYNDILEEYTALVNKQQSSPDSLSSILRECREETMDIGVNTTINRQFRVRVMHLAEAFDDIDDAVMWLEANVMESYPSSAFAARRREKAVEPVDPIAEMLAEYPTPWTYDENEKKSRAANGKETTLAESKAGVLRAKGIVAAVNAYQPTPAEPTPDTRNSSKGY
jgi:chromosome segregation ATPase